MERSTVPWQLAQGGWEDGEVLAGRPHPWEEDPEQLLGWAEWQGFELCNVDAANARLTHWKDWAAKDD